MTRRSGKIPDKKRHPQRTQVPPRRLDRKSAPVLALLSEQEDHRPSTVAFSGTNPGHRHRIGHHQRPREEGRRRGTDGAGDDPLGSRRWAFQTAGRAGRVRTDLRAQRVPATKSRARHHRRERRGIRLPRIAPSLLPSSFEFRNHLRETVNDGRIAHHHDPRVGFLGPRHPKAGPRLRQTIRPWRRWTAAHRDHRGPPATAVSPESCSPSNSGPKMNSRRSTTPGEKSKIGGEDVDLPLRMLGEIDAILGPHLERFAIQLDVDLLGPVELGARPRQPGRGHRPRLITDGDDLGIGPLARQVEQLSVAAELSTVGVEGHRFEFGGQEFRDRNRAEPPRAPP